MSEFAQAASATQTKRWRTALLAVCLCCIGLRPWAMAHLENSVVPDAVGGLDAELSRPGAGPLWLLDVTGVRPDSDLERQGVKVGDRLSHDRVGDAYRAMGVDEVIPVTVESGGQLRPLMVRTVPESERVNAIGLIRQLGGLVESCLALLLAAALSWKRADSNAVQALALVLAIYGISDVQSHLPGGLTRPCWAWVSASPACWFPARPGFASHFRNRMNATSRHEPGSAAASRF